MIPIASLANAIFLFNNSSRLLTSRYVETFGSNIKLGNDERERRGKERERRGKEEGKKRERERKREKESSVLFSINLHVFYPPNKNRESRVCW
jgi:hypothetical protein